MCSLCLESLYLFLRASVGLILPKLIIFFLELGVLICVALHKLLNVSLKVIDALLFACSQVLTLGLRIAKLLVELADLSLALLNFINTLLIRLEKLVLETCHLSLEI